MKPMAGSSIKEVKEVKLNPSKPFTGKRMDLNRFLQDIFVYLFINNDYYNTDKKKIGFVLSFLMEGDAAYDMEGTIH